MFAIGETHHNCVYISTMEDMIRNYSSVINKEKSTALAIDFVKCIVMLYVLISAFSSLSI